MRVLEPTELVLSLFSLLLVACLFGILFIFLSGLQQDLDLQTAIATSSRYVACCVICCSREFSYMYSTHTSRGSCICCIWAKVCVLLHPFIRGVADKDWCYVVTMCTSSFSGIHSLLVAPLYSGSDLGIVLNNHRDALYVFCISLFCIYYILAFYLSFGVLSSLFLPSSLFCGKSFVESITFLELKISIEKKGRRSQRRKTIGKNVRCFEWRRKLS